MRTDLSDRIIESSPFLKSLCKDTKPLVDAMTAEQQARFLNRIMEAGKPTPKK